MLESGSVCQFECYLPEGIVVHILGILISNALM